ncbi:hypothetical protein [Endozoicomonas arenosclerae]|uniref:hypothetical protein n=1 Tax=Endozoicomonas arenosclerae TaxID=1633495 RepID=UPI000780AC13|nr:hypothetical protein [Endozoicomonas arenosclerae]
MSILSDKQALVLGLAVLVGGVVVYHRAKGVVQAVNPLNPDNVIHRTAEQLAAEATGNPDALQDGFDLLFTTFDFSNPNNWFNRITGRKP